MLYISKICRIIECILCVQCPVCTEGDKFSGCHTVDPVAGTHVHISETSLATLTQLHEAASPPVTPAPSSSHLGAFQFPLCSLTSLSVPPTPTTAPCVTPSWRRTGKQIQQRGFSSARRAEPLWGDSKSTSLKVCLLRVPPVATELPLGGEADCDSWFEVRGRLASGLLGLRQDRTLRTEGSGGGKWRRQPGSRERESEPC